ncbi:MAG: TIR domain-containing protein [Alphaproteobacteria bacterium]|nr:MAG: TIR domain-containing protein [Alphaproteobacteria bacterium]
MSDVFISYSRNDKDRVEKLVEAMRARGIDVWWDPKIRTGTEFRFEIAQALENARVVVVVWSAHSVASRFVWDEADEGAQRGALVPALFDLVDIPLGFRQIQTADLSRWHGKRKDPALMEFLDVVQDAVKYGRKAKPVKPTKKPKPVAHEEPQEVEETTAPAPAPERQPSRSETRRRPRRSAMVTGQRMRTKLFMKALMLTVLIGGAFGALAYLSDFVFDAYRPYMVGAIAGLVFISRFSTFEADRAQGAASLRLLPRSYLALLFFAAISIAPALLEGRMYAAALQAVRMEGVEGADINGVAFSSDGNEIITTSDDTTARLWDSKTGVELGIYGGHEHWVWGAGFSPDGSEVVTASRDMTAQVWSTKNRKPIETLKGHTASVYDAAFSPDGKTIATASADKTVRLWNVESGESIALMSGHTDKVTGLDFSPSGNTLGTVSEDGTLRLWRVPSGSALGRMTAGSNLLSVDFNNDGTQIAASDENGQIYVWDVGSRSLVRKITAPTKQYGVAFAGNKSQFIAGGGLDDTLRIWKISDGEILHELTGHESDIRAVSAAPDGAYVATASRDNTARIWDVETGKQVQIMGHIKPALRLPMALDLPPYITASRAPVPLDVTKDRDELVYLLGKGFVLASILLLAGLFFKGFFKLIRLQRLSNISVVLMLGLPTLYIAALMVSALPIQAMGLWATIAFLPAAVYALLRWIATKAIVRR